MTAELIDQLPEHVRADLFERMVFTTHEHNERIWNEGQPADGIHLVVSGYLAVKISTPDGDEAMLAVLGPGDVFGELALLGDDQRRTASVIALDRARTKRVSNRDWAELRSRHPEIDELVTKMMAGYVIRLGEHLTEVLFVPAETRVIRQLVRLCAKYRSSGSMAATVRLTGQELADLAGVARQTVSTLLGSEPVAALGVDVNKRGSIVVHDVDALEAFADTMKQSKRS